MHKCLFCLSLSLYPSLSAFLSRSLTHSLSFLSLLNPFHFFFSFFDSLTLSPLFLFISSFPLFLSPFCFFSSFPSLFLSQGQSLCESSGPQQPWLPKQNSDNHTNCRYTHPYTCWSSRGSWYTQTLQQHISNTTCTQLHSNSWHRSEACAVALCDFPGSHTRSWHVTRFALPCKISQVKFLSIKSKQTCETIAETASSWSSVNRLVRGPLYANPRVIQLLNRLSSRAKVRGHYCGQWLGLRLITSQALKVDSRPETNSVSEYCLSQIHCRSQATALVVAVYLALRNCRIVAQFECPLWATLSLLYARRNLGHLTVSPQLNPEQRAGGFWQCTCISSNCMQRPSTSLLAKCRTACSSIVLTSSSSARIRIEAKRLKFNFSKWCRIVGLPTWWFFGASQG